MNIGVLLSLIPLFSWGISDYGAAKMSKHHPVAVSACTSLLGTSWALALIAWKGLPSIGAKELAFAIGAAVFINLAFILLVKAYSVGAVGVVTPIANSYAVVVALLSMIISKTVLPLQSWVAMVIVIGGLALLTHKKDEAHSKKAFDSSVYFSLLAFLFFGIGFFFFDLGSSQAWYHNFSLFQLVNLPFAWLLVAFAGPKENKLSRIRSIFRSKWLYAPGFIGTFGAVALFLAIEKLDGATIPAAIGAGSPLVTSLIAFYFDNEKLSAIQRGGAVLAVFGIVLLSL